MTSERRPGEAYVWVWLPGATRPVVAGRISRAGERLVFNYGRSYLGSPDAMPLYLPELPLERGLIPPAAGLTMAGCLRDSAPDAWGRRVILNRLAGLKGADADVDALDELTYLLQSGSDRTGALDFQASPEHYFSRDPVGASLQSLLQAAEKVDKGIALEPGLDQALFHGSSLGGARPKAMIDDGTRKLIAKFSSSSDTLNVVKAEFVAMRLAAEVGLTVASVELVRSAGRDVLLVERFDRVPSDDGWHRRAMVSALTLFGLDELMARYASYADLAEIVRHRFTRPKQTLAELYGRLVFNVLCGNTDDHARNHAAFWDGRQLSLTPAYDICPQLRTGNAASQAMLITGQDRTSRIATCLAAAPHFLLGTDEATNLIAGQIRRLRAAWSKVCREAGLSQVDRSLLSKRVFLNPFIFEGAPPGLEARLD